MGLVLFEKGILLQEEKHASWKSSFGLKALILHILNVKLPQTFTAALIRCAIPLSQTSNLAISFMVANQGILQTSNANTTNRRTSQAKIPGIQTM